MTLNLKIVEFQILKLSKLAIIKQFEKYKTTLSKFEILD